MRRAGLARLGLFAAFAGVSGVSAGCGLGAAEGGGSDLLPTAGLGPYGKVEALDTPTSAMEPFVIVDNVARLSEPSALARPFGGFRIWYTRQTADETAIYVSDIASVHESPPEAPVRVLAADEPWEAGAVSAPSVVRFAGEVLMYYEAGGMIGLAVSTDDGASFAKGGPLLPGRSPGAAVLGDRLFLYTEADDGLRAAISDDGRVFTPHPEPVLVRRDTDALAFDRLWVGQPAAVGGDDRVALFYVGRDLDGDLSVGAAASRDGLVFERAGGGEAILEPGLRDETGPSAVLFPAQGVLFFAQPFAQVTAIAVATSP